MRVGPRKGVSAGSTPGSGSALRWRLMNRRITSVFIITGLFTSNLAVGQEVTGADADSAYGKPMLAGHPIGSMIDVILAQTGDRITGKLIALWEDSFEIEVAKAPQVSGQRTAFADVQNVISNTPAAQSPPIARRRTPLVLHRSPAMPDRQTASVVAA
jgi:hypothetical protein